MRLPTKASVTALFVAGIAPTWAAVAPWGLPVASMCDFAAANVVAGASNQFTVPVMALIRLAVQETHCVNVPTDDAGTLPTSAVRVPRRVSLTAPAASGMAPTWTAVVLCGLDVLV